MEKAEVLKNFFAPVFSGNLSFHISQAPEPQGREWGKEVPPSVRKDKVRDHVRKVNIHRSMGSDEMHPRVTIELTAVVAKLLCIIFDKSWQSGEVCSDWKKGNIMPIFKKGNTKDPRNYQRVSLTSMLSKIVEQIVLDAMSRHMSDREVIRDS